MSKLPRRTQILAIVGAGLIPLALVLKFVVWRPPANVVSPPLVVHHQVAAEAKPKEASADTALPVALRRQLAHHGVVVAVLYSTGVAGDLDTVAAARQGAGRAHAGFAALDVGKEPTARAVALNLHTTFAPSIVVIHRQSHTTFALPGNADAQMVAQAAAKQP